MSHRASLLRLAVFLTVSGLLATGLGFVLADVRFTPTDRYAALFANVSQLRTGDQVRVSGVAVGKVREVRISAGHLIKVDFDVDRTIPVTTATLAAVRYKNLIGDRFLELDQGTGSGRPLRAGESLPATNTTAALDLDTLLNGFKPLFEGLDPQQINDLSTDLVNVLQGQSGSIYSLLSSVASLTGTLAEHDQLIGDVITNLNTALGTIDDRSATVSDLIVQLHRLMSGLADDKDPLGVALVRLNRISSSASDLLQEVRPDLRAEVDSLDAVSTTLNRNMDTVRYVLDKLPKAYQRLARAGSFGGFFNFFMCGLRFKLDTPSGPTYTPYTFTDAARCR